MITTALAVTPECIASQEEKRSQMYSPGSAQPSESVFQEGQQKKPFNRDLGLVLRSD